MCFGTPPYQLFIATPSIVTDSVLSLCLWVVGFLPPGGSEQVYKIKIRECAKNNIFIFGTLPKNSQICIAYLKLVQIYSNRRKHGPY